MAAIGKRYWTGTPGPPDPESRRADVVPVVASSAVWIRIARLGVPVELEDVVVMYCEDGAGHEERQHHREEDGPHNDGSRFTRRARDKSDHRVFIPFRCIGSLAEARVRAPPSRACAAICLPV